MLNPEQEEQLVQLVHHTFQPWTILDTRWQEAESQSIRLEVIIEARPADFSPPFLWEATYLGSHCYRCMRYLYEDFFH